MCGVQQSLAARSALVGADVEVPCVDGRMRRYVNLDYAASTPRDGRRVGRRRGVRPVVQQRPPRHRRKSQVCDRGVRGGARGRRPVRRRARRRRVVFVRNTTEAINVLAAALPAGTRVLSTAGRAPRQHAAVAPPRRCGCCRSPTRAASCSTRCERALRRATADRPARGHRRVERHRRGVAAGRARRGSRTTTAPSCSSTPPSSRRTAPIDMAGDAASTTSRCPATSSTRRSAPARSSAAARARARRAAAARRRRDRARHARRRRLGRRARALRGGLAQRDRRRRPRRGLPERSRAARDGRASPTRSAALAARLRGRPRARPRTATAARCGTTRRRPRRRRDLRRSTATATRSSPRS